MLLGAVQTKMARESGSAGGLGDVDGGGFESKQTRGILLEETS